MASKKQPPKKDNPPTLKDKNIRDFPDYYIENELYIFKSGYLLSRGYCCGNGCRHCPY